MPVGTCALCLQESELRDSHLIPRALYKRTRSPGDSNPNPVLVTDGRITRTSKQVSDYLLCASCEQLLNDRGERWVLENTWRNETTFRILDSLAAATPLEVASGFRAYDGAAAGLDVAKLAHFGASVFWRSAAHQWSAIEGQTPPLLDFGPYQEELRVFVFGSGPFPDNAALVVSTSTDKSVLRNERFTLPHADGHPTTYRIYRFAIPGLYFELLVGKVLPPETRHVCITRTGYIYTSFAKEEQALHAFWNLQRKNPALSPVKAKR